MYDEDCTITLFNNRLVLQGVLCPAHEQEALHLLEPFFSIQTDSLSIDLSDLSYINGAGLRALISCVRGSQGAFSFTYNTESSWQQAARQVLNRLHPGGTSKELYY